VSELFPGGPERDDYDYYLSVNGFTAWIGIILRKFGIVNKTVYWVWDYYPPRQGSISVRVFRYVYWYFDRTSRAKSDRVVYLDSGVAATYDSDQTVIPIGTKPRRIRRQVYQPVKLVHFGVLKKNHGLELIFRNAPVYRDREFHIVGSGPEVEVYRRLARYTDLKVYFHGYIRNDDEIDRIISACHIGLALYIPGNDSVTQFTDPSKIKRYISLGLPVITTKLTAFSTEIQRSESGIIVDYNDSAQVTESIEKIQRHYEKYSNNALKLARRYRYEKIYKDLFSF
jgi:glycosyltransferase involved in cell wall biosynthesis